MNNRTETKSETPDQLIGHISTLMDEAEAMLTGPVAEQTSEKLSQIHSRLERAQAQLSNIYGRARKKVVEGARATDETIRSHPYESLAIALGVGVLVGALIRRNNS